jgi:hypothetical protein
MKKTFLMRVGLFFLIFPLFVLIQAPSNVAVSAEHGWETAAAISCQDKQDAFPSSMFARLYRGINGTVSGFEIHLSYENGACSSLLYATNTAESRISASYHEENDDLVFALR